MKGWLRISMPMYRISVPYSVYSQELPDPDKDTGVEQCLLRKSKKIFTTLILPIAAF